MTGKYMKRSSDPMSRITHKDVTERNTLGRDQIMSILSMIERLNELTRAGEVDWRVDEFSGSQFYNHRPEKNTKISIHRFVFGGDVEYSLSLEIDKSKIGKFEGEAIDELGKMCYATVGMEKVKQKERIKNERISRLDALAGIKPRVAERKDEFATLNDSVSTDELIEKLEEDKGRNELMSEGDDYDKEKKKSKVVGEIGNIIVESNPIVQVLRSIGKMFRSQ